MLFQFRILSQTTVLTELQVTGLSTYGGDAVTRMFILEKIVWEFFMRNHSVHILYGIFHGGPKDGSWILPGTSERSIVHRELLTKVFGFDGSEIWRDHQLREW